MAMYQVKEFTRTRAELSALENIEVTPPGKLLIPLIRNLRQINAVLADYDEGIQRVLREVGEVSSRGWVIPADDEYGQAVFYQTQTEMLETEVEVDIHPLALSRFIEATQEKPSFQVPLRCFTRLTYLIELDVDEIPDDVLADNEGEEHDG